MPTPRDGHRKRMDMIEVLVKFDLSNQEIAQTLGVSRDTIVIDKRTRGIFSERRRHHQRVRFSYMLFVYAELIAAGRTSENEELSPDAVNVLKRGLEIALHIPEVLASLKGAHAAVSAPIIRDDPRAERYRKLIRTILEERAHQHIGDFPDAFLREYLVELYRGNTPLSDSFQVLCDRVGAAYLTKEAVRTKPCWTDETTKLVIQILDEIVATLTPREQQILNLHFRLKEETETLSLDKIATILGLSRERTRQVESRALRELKRPSKSELLMALTKSSAELLEDRLHQALRDKYQKEAEKLLQKIERGQAGIKLTMAQLRALTMTIDELEISARAYNALENFIGIRTPLWELVQENERDMLKTKNCGRKTMEEIKQILAAMGLHLGMQFDDATKLAYEAFRAIQKQI